MKKTTATVRDAYADLTARNPGAPLAHTTNSPSRAAFEAAFERAWRRTTLGNPRLRQAYGSAIDMAKTAPARASRIFADATAIFEAYAAADDDAIRHATAQGTIIVAKPGPARTPPAPVQGAPSQAAATFRDAMQRRGFRFAIEGDKLAISPAHGLTGEDRRRITDLRDALLGRLKEERALF